MIGTDLFRPTFVPLANWRYVWALPDTAGNLLYKAFLCLTNLTMVFQDVIMFLSVHGGRIHWSEHFRISDVPLEQGLAIPQAWTLGIELSFYALAPYLLNLRSRWLFLGAFFSFGLKMTAINTFLLNDPWTYRFFPFEIGYFLAGALAFRYRSFLEGIMPRRVGVYCIYPLVIAFTAFCGFSPGQPAYPLALAFILPFIFRMTSNLKIDRLVGELSYPFYIFHVFAIAVASFIVKHWLQCPESSVAWIGLGLTLVLSVNALTLETLIVEPWRARFAERRGRSESQ
jgi:peptidoglycan/LPS O-acetylase OafA/YrhL